MGKLYRYKENIMDHFYVILPSDSSAYYFPGNTIANFRTNWLQHSSLNMIHGKLDKKRFLHNTLRLDSEESVFSVKHYEAVFDILTNIPTFYESSIN